jgi:hypothetical protein
MFRRCRVARRRRRLFAGASAPAGQSSTGGAGAGGVTASGAFSMDNSWQFFMGYRYALFNFATQSVGGSVKVSSFEIATP